MGAEIGAMLIMIGCTLMAASAARYYVTERYIECAVMVMFCVVWILLGLICNL